MNLSADSEEGKKRFTTDDLYRLQYTSLSGRWTSLGGTESWFENLVASRGIATAI